jgi:hypothetical protein
MNPDTVHPGPGTRPRDEGSVLTMILALMVIGSLAVFSLLSFATTLFTNRPPIEERDKTFWTAKSAMSMAMTLQREYGPAGCYKTTDTFTLNGLTANVTCTPTGLYFGTGRGRFAIITTTNDPSAPSLAGNGPGAEVKPISGSVVLNGGAFGPPTSDLGVQGVGTGVAADVALSNYESPFTAPAAPASPATRYFDPVTATAAACTNPDVVASVAFPNLGTAWNPICQVAPWWELAGDLNDAGTYDYPELPPMPAYLRPAAPQSTVGSCNVYYPGRYEDPLTLSAGDHFFPSGVYYFQEQLTLEPGARVVAGEGRWAGCTFDAEAAFAPTAPKFHAITGKGATFLLGGQGRIVADDASFRINRRVSDSTSRGSETVAIRSVNYTTAAPTPPLPVEIPDDVVQVADEYDAANPSCNPALSTSLCLERAADHRVQVTPSAPAASYVASTLTPADEIVSFDQSGGTAASNQLVTDGYVFVPNARVALGGGANADYRVRLTAGLVASSVQLAYDRAPSASSNWFLGVLDEPIQRQVDLRVTVTSPSGQRSVSRALMEVNIDESYAINGWTVDPNSAPPPPPTPAPAVTPAPTTAPPPPGPTPAPTTAPPAPTTAPPAPTTAPPAPTTAPPAPTTAPPPAGTPNAPCNVDVVDYTRAFGDGQWTGEFWNETSTFDFASPFSRAPDQTVAVAEVFKANDGAAPTAGINADYYRARFTRTFDAGAACTIDLRRGSDDGMRVFVNGVAVVDDWAAYAYKITEHPGIPVQAGTNEIVVEYYEFSGESGYSLEWRTS